MKIKTNSIIFLNNINITAIKTKNSINLKRVRRNLTYIKRKNTLYLHYMKYTTCLLDRVPKYSVANHNNLQDVDRIKGLHFLER